MREGGKFPEVARRLTGISCPIFGISCDPVRGNGNGVSCFELDRAEVADRGTRGTGSGTRSSSSCSRIGGQYPECSCPPKVFRSRLATTSLM